MSNKDMSFRGKRVLVVGPIEAKDFTDFVSFRECADSQVSVDTIVTAEAWHKLDNLMQPVHRSEIA